MQISFLTEVTWQMDDEWMRYSCQLALPGFGLEGQDKLRKARVLIAGAGGLGCPAALYLASAGIGQITIIDHDVVSISNLHRQILYTPADLGQSKVLVASARLRSLNPHIAVLPITEKLTVFNVMEIVGSQDLVIDCTDNFETKYLLNDACVLAGIPMIYGAIYQFEGQLALLNLLNDDGTRSPNYRDIFPAANAAAIPNCADGGVLPTVAGIVGCMQANEAIKWIAGLSKTPVGSLQIIDGATLQIQTILIGNTTNTKITRLPQPDAVVTISAIQLLNNIDKYDLVDVRTSSEREQEDIGGRHIPVAELAEHANELFTLSRTVLFYCESGRRSHEAAQTMSKRFPDKTWLSLKGGIRAWKLNSIKK